MKNSDQSAHPFHTVNSEGQITDINQYGLTKREYFAGLAMQGMLSNPELLKILEKIPPEEQAEFVCEASIEQADELLKQLEND